MFFFCSHMAVVEKKMQLNLYIQIYLIDKLIWEAEFLFNQTNTIVEIQTKDLKKKKNKKCVY